MTKISIDIILGTLLESGIPEATAMNILQKCKETAAREAEEKEETQKQKNDGYVVLVKDPNGTLSDMASALLIKKMTCVKDADGNPTDPCLWGINELEARINAWRKECVEDKPSLEQIITFYDILKKYPKKYAKPYGFSFASKEAVPVLSIDPASIMSTMFNLNPISKQG